MNLQVFLVSMVSVSFLSFPGFSQSTPHTIECGQCLESHAFHGTAYEVHPGVSDGMDCNIAEVNKWKIAKEICLQKASTINDEITSGDMNGNDSAMCQSCEGRINWPASVRCQTCTSHPLGVCPLSMKRNFCTGDSAADWAATEVVEREESSLCEVRVQCKIKPRVHCYKRQCCGQCGIQ